VYFKSLIRILGSEREIVVPARVELRFGHPSN
jgi:hypothetical protein